GPQSPFGPPLEYRSKTVGKVPPTRLCSPGFGEDFRTIRVEIAAFGRPAMAGRAFFIGTVPIDRRSAPSGSQLPQFHAGRVLCRHRRVEVHARFLDLSANRKRQGAPVEVEQGAGPPYGTLRIFGGGRDGFLRTVTFGGYRRSYLTSVVKTGFGRDHGRVYLQRPGVWDLLQPSMVNFDG